MQAGVPCRDLLPAGAVGRGSPLTVSRSSAWPSRRPWPPPPPVSHASLLFVACRASRSPTTPSWGRLSAAAGSTPRPTATPSTSPSRQGPPRAGRRALWRAGGASAWACFWGAPPGTVGRALASLLVGGFSWGAEPTVAVTAVCPWGGPSASRLPGGPWAGHGDGKRFLGRVPRRDCPHARCWGREGMGGAGAARCWGRR